MIMKLLDLALLAFALQAFLLAFYIFIKREGNKLANRLFGIYLGLFGYSVFYVSIFWTRFNTELFLNTVHTFWIVHALFGPVFYFYIRAVCNVKKPEWRDSIHLIPLVLVLIKYHKVYLLTMSLKYTLYEERQLNSLVTFFPYLEELVTLLMFFYTVICFKMFIRSINPGSKIYTWTRTVCILNGAFVLSFVNYHIMVRYGTLDKEHDYILTFCMIAILLGASYFHITRPNTFELKPDLKPKPAKYENSALTNHFADEMKTKLLHLMERDKIFLNPELKLDDLSEGLNLSRHLTSQLINEQFASSFYEFVNYYRIEEAKKLLLQRGQVNIEEIALKSGFNNRTSFYNSFKKNIRISPTEYRNHFTDIAS